MDLNLRFLSGKSLDWTAQSTRFTVSIAAFSVCTLWSLAIAVRDLLSERLIASDPITICLIMALKFNCF